MQGEQYRAFPNAQPLAPEERSRVTPMAAQRPACLSTSALEPRALRPIALANGAPPRGDGMFAVLFGEDFTPRHQRDQTQQERRKHRSHHSPIDRQKTLPS